MCVRRSHPSSLVNLRRVDAPQAVGCAPELDSIAVADEFAGVGRPAQAALYMILKSAKVTTAK
jgi:hypothetical protein